MIKSLPRPPRPNPKRLSERKRVTLIMGARYDEGLIFCSDMEQNTASGGKRSVRKMFESDGPVGGW